MGKYLSSFYDGIITGLDPIGTYIGHRHRNTDFMGYVSDNFSRGKQLNLDLLVARPYLEVNGKFSIHEKLIPIDRSVPEQIIKGTGTSVGFVFNSVTYGIPQFFALYSAMNSFVRRAKIKILSRNL